MTESGNLTLFIKHELQKRDETTSHSVQLIKWNNWVPTKVNTLINMENEQGQDANPGFTYEKGVAIPYSHVTYALVVVKNRNQRYHIFTSCQFINTSWAIISAWLKIESIYAFTFEDLMKIHERSQDVA